jgi:integrase
MLTVAQVRSLTLAMPGHLQAAVTLAAWGGLRRGEVLALRRGDVDELRSMVHVERGQVELSDGTLVFGPPKTEAGVRNVHLPKPAMSDVTSHLASYVGPEPDDLVFTGRAGVPMRPKTLATAFNSARLRCGLPGVRFHDLRHFALTMAAATGATTKELMRRAGHSSPAAALRYQHATEDGDKAIAEALSGLASDAQVVPITEAKQRRSRTQRARQVTP